MKKLTLDFMVVPRQSLLAWCVLALGAGVLMVAADDYEAASDRLEHQQQAQQRLKRQVEARLPKTALAKQASAKSKLGVQSSATSESEEDKRRQKEQRLVDMSMHPSWVTPLEVVEYSADKKIALLSMAADPTRRQLRLTLESRTLDDALTFAQKLRESGQFDEVLLLSHDTKQSTGVDVLSLNFVLTWKASA